VSARPGQTIAGARLGIIAALVVVLAAACNPAGGQASVPPATTSQPAASLGSCPTSQPPALAAGQKRTVTIQTAKGAIVIEVDGALSPIAAGNFVALASCGYYDGVVFHRVVPGFVIQGGDGQFGRQPGLDTSQVGTGGPGYTIQDETVTATYGRGVVAMARSQAPNSQGSQFFIVLDDSARESLAAANTYAIFGHVTSGMNVADAIAAAADGEIPSHPIAMDHVTVSTP
jgi:peptidyl-prolyl cis-trans isomerase B (cyclophilin B)